MSIGEVLMILWRRSWIAVLTLLTAILAAAAVLVFVPSRYDAIATAAIADSGLDPLAGPAGSSRDTIGIQQGNMLQLITSKRVAVEVVKRLSLTANPLVQNEFRNSPSFGRESIDDWMADSLLGKVAPGFNMGSTVLAIKYKSGDPNQAAVIANAFLAATIDATIAMKAASAEQTARWFDPQLEALRKEVDAARSKVEAYQKETNLAGAQDTATNHLMMVMQNLSSAKANVTYMQARLAGSAAELLSDASDPDLQELNGLRGKLSELESAVAATKTSLGANNPKVAPMQSMIASINKQIPDVTQKATEKIRAHLKQRIAQTQQLIGSLETEQEAAQKAAVVTQAQRDRLTQLQRDVDFRLEELNAREKSAAEARLQSKLTFADIAVLDKAVPPLAPAFPKPMAVIPVAVGAGLMLGLILALLAEMIDRRVRSPRDLGFVTSAPSLGVIKIGRSVGRTSPRLLSP